VVDAVEGAFEVVPEGDDVWRVVRRGRRPWSFSSRGTLADIRERLESALEHDAATIAAYDEGRFEALCDIGWHRSVETGAWFRPGGRGPGPSWTVGPVPFRFACTWMMVFNPNEPGIPCRDCGRAIPGHAGGIV
jgi:hypothetical protein